MTTAAKGSFGTKLYVQKADATWLDLAGVGDFSEDGESLAMEDATTHDSTAGASETIPVGVTDVGTIQLTLNFVENNASNLEVESLFTNRTRRAFRVVWPQGTLRRTGEGFIQAISRAHPVRGKQVRTLTIAKTGPWVTEPNV